MRKVVYKNRYFSVERETFKVRGREVELFREEKPDAVVVVPQLRDGRFLVERNYRHVLKRRMYEFPAGYVEKGETPKAAALRELKEETGYGVRRITPLRAVYWTPGNATQRLFFFHAYAEKTGKRHLDDMEVISLVKMDIATLGRMVRSGKISDAKTALAFLLYSKYFAEK